MSPKILIFMLFMLAIQIQYSDIQCDCSQILSESDCQQASCSWSQSECTQNKKLDIQIIDNTYCLPLTQAECQKNSVCYWNSQKQCTHFTACSALEVCLSPRCKLVDDQCYEISECSTYQNQETCLINQTCYWDSQCIVASSCDQLRFKNDNDCRKAMSTCTVNSTLNGCQDGQECSEYQKSDQCVQNRLQTQACFWDGNKCLDKICTNAPNHEKCSEFLPTCITTGSGCILKTVCSAAKVKEACDTDIEGHSCYWNDETNYCFEKNLCSYASADYISNEQCRSFLSYCITTNGGGCVTNLSCKSANIEIACEQDSNGNICLWENEVCLQKTCDSAPTTIAQNGDCELYLPKKNCITKLGGGCTINTVCSAIKIQIACIKDVQGNDCFWDSDTCKDKKCDQVQLTTHEECQKFLTTCTVNSKNNGCVDWVCENSLDQSICSQKSHSQRLCHWKDSNCSQRECSLAPSTYTTHQECEDYLEKCTLSNLGYGCMPIPLKCEAITIQAACVKKFNQSLYNECGWNGQFCIDKQCETAPKNYQITSECNAYVNGCVSSNPNPDGIVIGCMIQPLLCEDRKTFDNCPSSDCFWNSVQAKCVIINCSAAVVEGTPDQIQIVSAAACYTFQALGCLISNDGSRCIDKVTSCNLLLTPDNCKDESKVDGSCFWNSSQLRCLDKVCRNINYTTHENCNSALSSCTVNQLSINCMELAENCSSYVTSDQCRINSQNIQCIWTGIICRNVICDDAPQSDLFDSDSECQNFKVSNTQTCTVIPHPGYGCVSKQKKCEDYSTAIQCYKTLDDSVCVWNNNKCFSLINFSCENIIIQNGQTCESVLYSCYGSSNCQAKTCDQYTTIDGKSTGNQPITTDQQCQALDPTCTISNNNACQTKAMICSQYNQQVNCTQSIYGDCIWVSGSNTCVQKGSLCYIFTGSSSTCQSYNQFCTQINSDSDACTSKQCSDFNGPPSTYTYSDCQSINITCSVNLDGSSCIAGQSSCSGYLTQDTCVYASSLKCIWDSTQCFSLNYSTSCSIISNYYSQLFTNDICQSYFPKCRANNDGTACIDMMLSCDNYININDCTQSFEGYCIIDSNNNCQNITPATKCSGIRLKIGTAYTHDLCNLMQYTCTGDGTKCMDMTCDNKLNANSFDDCQNWLSTCTYTGNQKCTQITQTCSQQTADSCYRALDGECVIQNNQCVNKTCEQAEPVSNYWNNFQCSTYMSTCIVQPGGCQQRVNCSAYTSEIQCKFSLQGDRCFWNPSLYTCVYLSCSNIEQTSLFDSYNECVAVDSSLLCTVRESGNGCKERRDCTLYSVEEQCHLNSQGQDCVWNIYLQPPACQDKSCNSVPKIIMTFEDCQLIDLNCTVGAIPNNSGGHVLQGCQIIGDCSFYIAKEQCLINQQGNNCVWLQSDQICTDKTCQTAPDTFGSNESCRSYLPNCTVSETGQGCIEILNKCEQFKLETQCHTDLQGNQCYWTTGNMCVAKTCENAPNNIIDETGCNSYLNGCTLYTNKCRVEVCEDYAFKTDKACKAIMRTCTTDGTKCVLRGTCLQAQSRYGCITQNDGQLCAWVNVSGYEYCTLKTCQTAPGYFVTESQCQSYFHNCIPKVGGGCVKKSTCQEVTVQEGCTTAIDGSLCVWDNRSCRIPICTDFKGQNHQICNKQGSNCTIGLYGQCQNIQLCSQTKIKAACILGIDGPCLWIDGACYQYNSCTSLNWTTHEQCQKISDKCTTDGTKCIGITLCEKNNVNGGCVIGTDGHCYQTINESGVKTCNKFTKCSDYALKTHKECEAINSQCTTDGAYKCMDLSSCDSYSQVNCVIDNNNQECEWNNEKKSCFQITTPMQVQNCADYKLQNTCLIGKEGKCKWYDDFCGIDCSDCSSKCIQDGDSGCIPKTYCNSYKNNSTCSKDGLDGSCQWNQGICSLMTECSQANFELCIRNHDKCLWNGKDGKNICTELNCQSSYQITGLCSIVLKLNNSIPLVCQLINNVCTQVDPNKLTQETCFLITKYTYTWDSKHSGCYQCGTNYTQSNNTTNNIKQDISGQQVILNILILLII